MTTHLILGHIDDMRITWSTRLQTRLSNRSLEETSMVGLRKYNRRLGSLAHDVVRVMSEESEERLEMLKIGRNGGG